MTTDLDAQADRRSVRGVGSSSATLVVARPAAESSRRALNARLFGEAGVFVVALVARLIPQIIHGGVTGNFGYDPSVYYAAADSFIHGRMPYRDFLLLHPPGIVLADTPFAWLGSVTSDQVGFAAVTFFFVLLGATNAVLVVRLARRLGVARIASLVGGTVYALYPGALFAEYEARLEPLGCFLLLCALLAVTSSRSRSRGRDATTRAAVVFAVLAGVLLGSAMSVKIWWTVPALVLVGWELAVHRAVRRGLLMLCGLTSALLVIDGPFWLVAGSKMWQMVVLDQLGRPPNNLNVTKPLSYLLIGWLSMGRTQTALDVTVAVGALVLLVLVVRAWRIRAVRSLVLVLLAQVVMIVIEPTWFQFYADYVTVALSTAAAAAVMRRAPALTRSASEADSTHRDVAPWFAVAIAACLAAGVNWTVPENILVTRFPAARLAAVTAGYRCVMSDSPMALIEMNDLTRDLRHGCPNRVDTTGLIFELDRRDAHDHDRDVHQQWNEAMASYLRSGDAVLFFRPLRAIDLLPATGRVIEQNGAIAQVGGFTLYRVLHPVHANSPA